MSRKHMIVFLLGVISLSAVAIAQEDAFQRNAPIENPPSNSVTAAGLPVAEESPRESPSVITSPYDPFSLEKRGGRRVRNTAEPLAGRDDILAHETRALLAEYVEATDSTKKEETAETLKQIVTEHFEVKQQVREAQLVELEARVKRLRELHDRRTAAKTTIIAKRLELLLDEAKGVGWDVSSDRKDSRGGLSSGGGFF